MARDAIREALNLIFVYKFGSQGELVIWVLVGHIEHLVFWPNILGRISVTFKAPFHIKCVDFVRERHLVDPTVTSGTADAFVYMDAVIEVNKVRQVVNARPFERLYGAEVGANGLKDFGIGPDLRVTGHADFG